MAQAPRKQMIRGERVFLDVPGLFIFWLNVFEKRTTDADGKPIEPDKQRFELAAAFPKSGPRPDQDPTFMLLYGHLADVATKNFGGPQFTESLAWGNKRFQIRDGDAPGKIDMQTGQPQPPREFLRGHWYINLKSYDPIGLGVMEPSGAMRNAVPSDFYAGVFAKLALHVRASVTNGNATVSFFAESVVKVRDGQPISDRSGGGNKPMDQIWGCAVAPAPAVGAPGAAFGAPPAGPGFGAPPAAPAFGAPPAAPAFGAPPAQVSTALPPAQVTGFGQQPGFAPQPQPGFAPQPQPGFAPQPQPGFAPQPQPGFAPQPQPGFGQATQFGMPPFGQ